MQVQRYTDDPLIYHGSLKAKWCSEALSAIKEVRQKVHEITLPMLIFHGNDDQLVPFSASEFIFANVSSCNKTFEVCNHKHNMPYSQKLSPGEHFAICFHWQCFYLHVFFVFFFKPKRADTLSRKKNCLEIRPLLGALQC